MWSCVQQLLHVISSCIVWIYEAGRNGCHFPLNTVWTWHALNSQSISFVHKMKTDGHLLSVPSTYRKHPVGVSSDVKQYGISSDTGKRTVLVMTWISNSGGWLLGMGGN